MGRRAVGGVVVAAASPCCCAEGDRLVEVVVGGRGRDDGNWLPYEVEVEMDGVLWKMAISPMSISVLYRWDWRTSVTKGYAVIHENGVIISTYYSLPILASMNDGWLALYL